jgi:hypothetical protein
MLVWSIRLQYDYAQFACDIYVGDIINTDNNN